MKVLHFDKVTSTQDVAKDLLQNSVCEMLIISDVQASGRGRLNERSWISTHGNFHGSFVIDNKADMLVYKALNIIKDFILLKTRVEANIKHPNDVLINNKKIAGVLVEIFGNYAIVGVGFNTNNSPLETSTYLHFSNHEFAEYFYSRIIHDE